MREVTPQELLPLLEQAEHVLIWSHVGPDGDAVGSALGLMWLLRAQGKRVEVSFEDPIPAALHFLPGAGEITDLPLGEQDLLVAVDGSDAERYGAHFLAALEMPDRPPLLGIDHHKTNSRFADRNWVDSGYAATAQMLVHLADLAGWPLEPRAATCLATGCVTDSNAFSTDHTTPELLETVARLMRAGAPLAHIIRQAMSRRSAPDALLWGRILATARVEGGVAWAVHRAADRAAVGASEQDGSGIATFLRNIEGVHVGALLTEVEPATTRVSLRSEPGYDVGSLALTFGGGGHTQAAGATLALPLEEAVERVVEGVKRVVRQEGE